jgi:hypothetical protein
VGLPPAKDYCFSRLPEKSVRNKLNAAALSRPRRSERIAATFAAKDRKRNKLRTVRPGSHFVGGPTRAPMQKQFLEP